MAGGEHHGIRLFDRALGYCRYHTRLAVIGVKLARRLGYHVKGIVIEHPRVIFTLYNNIVCVQGCLGIMLYFIHILRVGGDVEVFDRNIVRELLGKGKHRLVHHADIVVAAGRKCLELVLCTAEMHRYLKIAAERFEIFDGFAAYAVKLLVGEVYREYMSDVKRRNNEIQSDYQRDKHRGEYHRKRPVAETSGRQRLFKAEARFFVVFHIRTLLRTSGAFRIPAP